MSRPKPGQNTIMPNNSPSPAGPPGPGSSTSTAGGQNASFQEFSVRVPKVYTRPHSVMRFNAALNVDFSTWSHVKMCREDDAKHHHKLQAIKEEQAAAALVAEELPKFGAGSEFGREAKDEARRKKYGQLPRKKVAQDQPWIVKTTVNEVAKKYRGLREGGVSANASYYIFTQAPDGQFEVFPVDHWFNFTPVQTYKSLNAEEAEEEFQRRNKVMNLFSVMVRKRMKKEDGDEEDEPNEGGSKRSSKKKSDFKVSEMDDWEDSGESGDEEEGADKKKKAKKPGKKNKKKKDSDDEMGEDSDDGDDEGRELDYMSDSTGSESGGSDKEEKLIGVEQEQGLLDLLETDTSEDSDEDKNEQDKKDEDAEKDEQGKRDESRSSKDKKKKKNKNKSKKLSDSDDSEPEKKEEKDSVDSKVFQQDQPSSSSTSSQNKIKDEFNKESISIKKEYSNNNESNNASSSSKKEEASSSASSTIAGIKRKISDAANSQQQPAKKPKPEVSSQLIQAAATEGITEEAVRRYLLRKPMTVTELLHKFKSKKTKMASQDMVNVIASILKTINPTKRMQNQKMYLFLKN